MQWVGSCGVPVDTTKENSAMKKQQQQQQHQKLVSWVQCRSISSVACVGVAVGTRSAILTSIYPFGVYSASLIWMV